MGEYENKYLDGDGVKFLWNTAKSIYQQQIPGKSLSDNNFSNEEKNKLAALENYELPIASDDELGGVKIGSGLTISEGGTISTTSDIYRYKGKVATLAELAEIVNPANGDVYGVEETGLSYAWNADEYRWDDVSSFFVVNSLTIDEIDDICR